MPQSGIMAGKAGARPARKRKAVRKMRGLRLHLLVGLIVSPVKFTLICDQLEWLGRMLHDGKVLLDPSYMAGVTAPLAPQGSQIMCVSR